MLYKSPKSTFSFEHIEQLPETPDNFKWTLIELSKPLGLYLLRDFALLHNYSYNENSASSTVIVNFYQSHYFTDYLEFHLTAVKLYDMYKDSETLSTLHLSLKSSKKSRSFYYDLQHSNNKHFRFIRNDYLANNQTDDMKEFIGFQGIYNFSSAVLQGLLQILNDLNKSNQVYIEKRCLKLKY